MSRCRGCRPIGTDLRTPGSSDLTQTSMNATNQDPPTFDGHLESSMQGLRCALSELLASISADPGQPQELARSCGINKNLAWKVCKIINSTDSFESVVHVPGASGVKIFCTALRSKGADTARVDAVVEAFTAYTRMMRLHAGDRASLQLYVDSRSAEGIHAEQIEDKRRMAYQGNSALWGVQARLGLTLRAIAPNAEDPAMVDFANTGGLYGFRRLRPTVSWPVLQQQVLADDIELEPEVREPVDPDHDGTGPPLVREFCSIPLPRTRTTTTNGTTTHELCEGPVGMTAAVDVTFGTVARRVVPVRGDSADSVGEHYCRVDTPLEAAQFDLLVHRDLPFELPPRTMTYSRLHGAPQFPLSQHPRFHLPGTPHVQDLGAGVDGLATPHIPAYPRLVELTCNALGCELDDFHAFRVHVTFPPMPTVLVLAHPLA